MDEWWRLLALVNISALIGLGFYLHVGHKPALPAPLYRAGWAYGLVLLLMGAAIFTNFLLRVPATPGLIIFSLITTVVTIYVAVEVVQIVRDR